MPDLDNLAADYARDGYAVAPGLFAPHEIAALNADIEAIVSGANGPVVGAEPHDGAAPQLESILAIHFPHKISPLMAATIRHPALLPILTRLIGPDVKTMQSQVFIKAAGKPGQAWHQDEHFIATRDRSLMGVWIALDDATIANGCLWMHPGSHRPGILYRTRAHDDSRFDPGATATDFPFDPEGGTAVEIAAGGVVFFNGCTLHRSLPNVRPQGFRRALVYHYMNAHSLLPWAFAGGERARADYRDILMAAGDDPYAWKGTEDIGFPFVRPDNPARAATILQTIHAKITERLWQRH